MEEKVKVIQREDSLLVYNADRSRAYYLQACKNGSGSLSRLNAFTKYNVQNPDTAIDWVGRLGTFDTPKNYNVRLRSAEPITTIMPHFIDLYTKVTDSGYISFYKEKYTGFVLTTIYSSQPVSFVSNCMKESFTIKPMASDETSYYLIFNGDDNEECSVSLGDRDYKYNISKLLAKDKSDGIFKKEILNFSNGTVVTIEDDGVSRSYNIETVSFDNIYNVQNVQFSGVGADARALKYISVPDMGTLVGHKTIYGNETLDKERDYMLLPNNVALLQLDYHRIYIYKKLQNYSVYYLGSNFGPTVIPVSRDNALTRYDAMYLFTSLLSHIGKDDVLYGVTPLHLEIAKNLYNALTGGDEKDLLNSYKAFLAG